MRVLVTGGRHYDDGSTLFRVLGEIHASQKITMIIHGDASGADRLASEWAEVNDVPVEAFPADWKQYGSAAGPIRNREMLARKPDLVVAFPGGRGTADMVRQAKAAGVRVVIVGGGASDGED